MKRFFYKLGILILLYLLIFIPLSSFFDSHYSKKSNQAEKVNWIFSQKNKKLDFAVIGSSRALNVVDIVEIEKKTGLSGINLGGPGNGYADNFIVLHKFFKNKNSINLLLIQLDIFGLNSKEAYNFPFHDYLYLPYLDDSIVYYTFKDNSDFLKLMMWKYVPFSKYIEFNNKYSLQGIKLESQKIFDYDSSKGSELLYNKGFTEGANRFQRELKIVANDVKYFNKLIKLAKQKGVKVVIFNSPTFFKQFAYNDNREEILGKIHHLVALNSLEYINFETDSICMNKNLFSDYKHLNASGAKIFSAMITDSLKIRNLLKQY